MGQKLGEILINDGLVTRKQLDEALKSQVIFGGRLGTNLVEMGIVSESDLLRCLSKQLEMPYATPEQLSDIPPEIIKLIPTEIAEEYKVVPLRLDKKRLTLAMWDPGDLASIDAISFITGYIIIPVVCSELRLLLALEQFYGIKRELRYIQLSGGTGVRSRETGASDAGAATQDVQEISPFETMSGEAIGQSRSPQAPAPEWGELAEILPTEPHTEPPSEIFRIDRQPVVPEFEPEVLELDEYHPQPPAAPAPAGGTAPGRAATPQKPEAGPITREAMLTALTEARDRDAIADAVAAYVGNDFERFALFMIKGKVAAGWKGSVGKKAIPRFETFELSLDELSAIKIVADTKNFYLGPLLDTPGNRKIIAALGGGTPETALLIPLMMMGRVVTVFYVDGHDVAKQIHALQKVAAKTALAFEILILKNKILA